MIALAATKDPEILKDEREADCAIIFEEYANGGLNILRDVLLRTGAEYPDRDILEYLKKNKYLDTDDQDADVTEISF